jgi:hypothetical protein
LWASLLANSAVREFRKGICFTAQAPTKKTFLPLKTFVLSSALLCAGAQAEE